MSENKGKESLGSNINEDPKVTKRIVQYVDDPKDSSALAKVHELSDKAKHGGKSPIHFHHIRIKDDEPIKNQVKSNFNRRKVHFPTVKHQGFNVFKERRAKLKLKESDKDVEKPKPSGKNKSNSNLYNLSGDNVKYKTEYVWDKSINRLVEKKVPIEQNEGEGNEANKK